MCKKEEFAYELCGGKYMPEPAEEKESEVLDGGIIVNLVDESKFKK